jgi:hypothetical protein
MKFRPNTKIKAPNGQRDPNQTDKNPLSAGVLGSYIISLLEIISLDVKKYFAHFISDKLFL